MRVVHAPSSLVDEELATKGGPMYIGLAILYFVLLITLGVMTIRKGHWVMFVVGIFLPIFWIIGAIMPPVRPAGAL
jgi:hypothetical protein